ncbi:hypothetical protein FRC17_000894 [Serendipita sp. 399]|nr:hypothetical protein FRC17_000894 [Serendipita sp. 399]
MPVTFKIASHDANEVVTHDAATKFDAPQVVERVWRADGISCKEMLQSSFTPNDAFSPRGNGFVGTVVEAYNRHHHLIIRPDDICVNTNAEALRSKFVAHEGKKELEIQASGSRYTVNFGKMATDMADLLKKNIVDDSLHEWVIPNFTTTTPNDVVICSVMLMSTLKKYFSYKFSTLCGIPSITLLGEKEDYLSILLRLDRLEEFGQEPSAFAHFLRPVIKEFANAFDYVKEEHTLPNPEFWGRICHRRSGGSGPTYLSGWITAFCVWGTEGKWQGGNLGDISKPLTEDEVSRLEMNHFGPSPPLVLENMRYPVIDTGDIPNGFCQVDVLLDDNGANFDCLMVAGHVGMATSGLNGTKDTVQPVTEWFMFIKGEKKQEQNSFYVNANAESLRSNFVAHEGNKALEVRATGTRYTVDFGKMANDMGELLKKNIVDETLHKWVIPDFTTTTPNDVVVCAVIMMSTLKQYFSYNFALDCGIPSINLLGEREDYLSILLRLDKLEEFGREPTMFAHLLRPVLKEFVNVFDAVKEGQIFPNPDFWGRICHEQIGESGPSYLSGWITSFGVWNAQGQWQGGEMARISEPLTSDEESSSRRQNMRYPVIDLEDIPKGFCHVDVHLDDDGGQYDCLVVAGHADAEISGTNGIKDTLQPSMEWFMFTKAEVERDGERAV